MSIERHITDQRSYDDALDHLVDTVPMSYDDARRKLDLPQFEEETRLPRPHHAVGARATETTITFDRSSRGPRGEEEGTGYPDGKPHYSRPVGDVFALWEDTEQLAVNQRGSADTRATMGWPPKNDDKPTKTASSH